MNDVDLLLESDLEFVFGRCVNHRFVLYTWLGNNEKQVQTLVFDAVDPESCIFACSLAAEPCAPHVIFVCESISVSPSWPDPLVLSGQQFC